MQKHAALEFGLKPLDSENEPAQTSSMNPDLFFLEPLATASSCFYPQRQKSKFLSIIETSPMLLVASHIKPWKDSTDKEKLDGCNGLLLSPHVDCLFDKGLISFNNDGDLLISKNLETETLLRWGLNKIKNVGKFSSGQIQYLNYHREVIFDKAAKSL